MLAGEHPLGESEGEDWNGAFEYFAVEVVVVYEHLDDLPALHLFLELIAYIAPIWILEVLFSFVQPAQTALKVPTRQKTDNKFSSLLRSLLLQK